MSGFDHAGITVSDYDASVAFYDSSLEPLGMKRLYEQSFPDGRVAGYGVDRSIFFIATGGDLSRRVHLAFVAKDHDQVKAFYEAALAVGGRDNGAPGPRDWYHPGYYAAFVFDPDGHNIEAVCHGTE
jgi:catechol 2,3-dioxygenase-like lactoylglutathione lyase family enzyme